MSEERMTKTAGKARADRDMSDSERTGKDGTALSAKERRNQLRNEWVQEILPTPPKIAGWHVCWLTTTNPMDPIYKRIQKGYIPVKAEEFPELGGSALVKDGEYAGCISCNEMLLFKIEDEMYQDWMAINHFDLPQEQERGIYEKVNNQEYDSNGKPLGIVEGDYGSLGHNDSPTPRYD